MKRLCAAMVAIILALSITSRAQAQSDAACGAVLCLYGPLTGTSGGAGCAAYIASYFAIRVFSHGFDGGLTSVARLAFLNQCTTAETGIISAINANFGTVYAWP